MIKQEKNQSPGIYEQLIFSCSNLKMNCLFLLLPTFPPLSLSFPTTSVVNKSVRGLWQHLSRKAVTFEWGRWADKGSKLASKTINH